MNNNSKQTAVAARLGRREREMRLRRGEILNAAERLFAKKGFFKTSMAEIAQEAEFAVGSLYQFFKSKDEIYVAIMEDKFEEYLRRLDQEVDRAKGVIERIETVISVTLQHFEEHRNFFRIYATEWGGSDCPVKGHLGEKIAKLVESHVASLARIMQAGIRQGLFKKMDSYELAYLFNGMMKSFIHQWIISPGEESLVGKAGTIKEIFLNGVSKTKP
jgi:AcrR family transcriptional regulator